MILSFWVSAYFQGRLLLVSGSVSATDLQLVSKRSNDGRPFAIRL